MRDFFSPYVLFRRALTLFGLCIFAAVLAACGRTPLETTSLTSGDAASPQPAADASLPETPPDLDLERRRLFHERLVPLGGATTPEENRALAAAIRTALTHPLLIHTDELEAFLHDDFRHKTDHPCSEAPRNPGSSSVTRQIVPIAWSFLWRTPPMASRARS